MTQTSNPTNRPASAIFGKILASSLVLGAGLGLSTSAAANDLVDQRGYQSCVEAFDTSDTRDLTGVTFPRHYYISRQADSTDYYLNAHAWENGARVAKRVACQTSKNGRAVLSVESGDGQYARSANAALNVAKR